jgi:hypothetical protein
MLENSKFKIQNSKRRRSRLYRPHNQPLTEVLEKGVAWASTTSNPQEMSVSMAGYGDPWLAWRSYLFQLSIE